MENPTFYHTPVLLAEAIEGLSIKEDSVIVDATFGGGGHSKEILLKLGVKGKLIAFDQDEDAWKNKPGDERIIPVKENFKYLKNFLRLHNIKAVDGILADLGVSSFQFDTAERGFSIRYDGPLDMRMDMRSDLTAAMVLKTYTEQQLHLLFEQYGEVRNARQLAKQIVLSRKMQQIDTIASLKAVLAPIMKGNPNRYLAQVFQALRIEVNDELGALKELLQQASMSLEKGGRLCIISFHSLEDRIVKHYMKSGRTDGEQSLDADVKPPFKMLTSKPIEPMEDEMKRNPRARSAKLRIAEKI